MRIRHATLATALTLVARAAAAQSAAEYLAAGDKEHVAMQPAAALKQYEAAVATEPKSYDALSRAAREAVDAGEYLPNEHERTALYNTARAYAQRAIEVRPGDAEGHFLLARAIGRAALAVGPRERIKYANDVRSHALEALKLDPKHPGALHVMGVWNAEVMRLNGVTRWFARNVLGGRVFGSASWDNAVRYMEQAVAVDPERLTHHLDLARVYADVGDTAKARQQYETVLKMAPHEPNDAARLGEAQRELAKLRGA